MRALLLERAQQYAASARSASTLRAYVSDWRHFEEWCRRAGLSALPAEPRTVQMWLADVAENYKISTLTRRLATIAQVHRARGYPDPPTAHSSVRAVWAGIRRQRREAPAGKAPVLVEDLRAMTAALPDNLLGRRDRALLLVGFAGAFRRAELAGLDVGDVRVTPSGLLVTIRASKTDQEGRGQRVAIPHGANAETCPVRAYQEWIRASGIRRGALFRRIDRHGNLLDQRVAGQAVSIVVKRAAGAAGLEPALFGGHSLRAGLATAAAIAGADDRKIMAQTRHKSKAMLERYVRDAELWRDNAAGQTGI